MRKTIFLLSIVVFGVVFNGCSKKRGCMDSAALNYDAAAEKEDGSCEYPAIPTAVDFTTNDCNGVQHHLFSELDAKTIVVMAWVMPCGTCVADPLATLSIVQSYNSSHPEQVVFYLVDDYANTSCSGLDAWAVFYGLGGATKFSDPAISMSDYGVDGMPKIVVLGGEDHRVYFNKNSSIDGVQDAINQALADNPI